MSIIQNDRHLPATRNWGRHMTTAARQTDTCLDEKSASTHAFWKVTWCSACDKVVQRVEGGWNLRQAPTEEMQGCALGEACARGGRWPGSGCMDGNPHGYHHAHTV